MAVSAAGNDSCPERMSAEVEADAGYCLELSLLTGTNLIARDSNGLSDPYIKIKRRKKLLYKTEIIRKTLNPRWNEEVKLQISPADFGVPLYVKVFDYDKFSGDDFMGQTTLNLAQLELNKEVECDLTLSPKCEEGSSLPDQLGHITIRYKLTYELDPTLEAPEPTTRVPVTDRSNGLKGEKFVLFNEWDYKVHIVLVNGKDLVPMDRNGFSDPFVKFRLQGHKLRSKIKNKTLNPEWLESFNLTLYEKKSWLLEMYVYDDNIAAKPDFIGRATLDLRTLEVDKTHDLTVHLEDEAGSLRLLITVTGAVSSTDHETSETRYAEIATRYGFVQSFRHLSDVGCVRLKIIRAVDLPAVNLSGNSDPFCTVELVNSHLQTHTNYNTLNPEWNKTFILPINDIHSVLEITVYDEYREIKNRFIGRVSIPLIQIRSGGARWYALKNSKLTCLVKGAILAEIDVCFNHFKAALRTLNPPVTKLVKEDRKLRIEQLKGHVNRVKRLMSGVGPCMKICDSLLAWEKPAYSVLALLVFVLAVWNFELWMLPLVFIMVLIWNLIMQKFRGDTVEDDDDTSVAEVCRDIAEEEDERESKKIRMVKLDTILSTVCTVQEVIGRIADHGESVKNSLNWSVPWLSAFAMFLLAVLTLILYYIPIRQLIILWGIKQFTLKFRPASYIFNNEILEFLSRVPSDVEKVKYKAIKPKSDIHMEFDSADGSFRTRSHSNRMKKLKR